MKVRGVVFSMVLGAGLTILPAAAHALRVVLSAGESSITLETEGGTLNLDCPAEGGGPTTGCASNTLGSPRRFDFGDGIVFTISKCTGTACSGGRARVFVQDGEGGVDTLVLTDAVIRNAGTQSANLTVRIDSGFYSTAGEPGPRAYAAELSGSFVPAAIDPFNRVRVSVHACFEGDGLLPVCTGGPTGNVRLVDDPALDAGEDFGEGQNPFLYSIVAPPYKPAGTSQFSPREQDIKFCPDYSGEVCNPALQLIAEISLKAGYSLRAPGSIGAAGSKAICDPESSDPERQHGCIAMAKYLATLGPKGAQMYDVRLEPSPGSPSVLDIRGVRNSSDQWTADRIADGDKTVGASKISALLQTNGSGQVTVFSLCNVENGCSPVTLPVRVYCGESFSTTFLHTDFRGNGKLDLVSASPCVDPAVLIMDEFNSDWVAAPLVP